MSATIHAEAEFVRDALYVHAAQVLRYCESMTARLEDLKGRKRSEERAQLIATGVNLVTQLEQLRHHARALQDYAAINDEQIEAAVAGCRRTLELVRHEYLSRN